MPRQPFYILALDGGGSKGVFSLGALQELEALVGRPLHEQFHLIYGTSVGAIGAAMIGVGKPMSEIIEQYLTIIPNIMSPWTGAGRTAALKAQAKIAFEDDRFDRFKTMVGIVAMNYETRKPMIFKSSKKLAHGLTPTFRDGFGCSIADAVVASCAAVPYFSKVQVTTENQQAPVLIDGGFVANNPTLFALADALGPLEIEKIDVRVISIGVGSYRERPGWRQWCLEKLLPVEAVLAANTNTLEIVRKLLLKDVRVVRIDDAFTDRQYETSLLEADVKVLKRLIALGRSTFGKHEAEVRGLLGKAA
jgi:predicted patatin/cPLA2 family phospholipase